MPYYVYRVLPFAQLRKLAEFDAYKAASAQAKTLRADATEPGTVKIIFADNELHAEDLLCQVRQAPPLGDD
jgi:hypothetical protein